VYDNSNLSTSWRAIHATVAELLSRRSGLATLPSVGAVP